MNLGDRVVADVGQRVVPLAVRVEQLGCLRVLVVLAEERLQLELEDDTASLLALVIVLDIEEVGGLLAERRVLDALRVGCHEPVEFRLKCGDVLVEVRASLDCELRMVDTVRLDELVVRRIQVRPYEHALGRHSLAVLVLTCH